MMRCLTLVCWLALAVTDWCAAQDDQDSARFENEIRAFEKSDARQMPPAGAVVALGSSSIRMWHPEIANDLAPLEIVPRGFGGSNMNDALHFADRVLLPYKPAAVLLYEGDNDIAQGQTPEAIVEKFRELTAKLHSEFPEARVYMIAIKPSPSRWEMWPEMKKANELLAAVCAADERLTYIDIVTPMLGEDGRPKPELFEDDELHLNRAGYEIWRDAVRPVLIEGEDA